MGYSLCERLVNINYKLTSYGLSPRLNDRRQLREIGDQDLSSIDLGLQHSIHQQGTNLASTEVRLARLHSALTTLTNILL